MRLLPFMEYRRTPWKNGGGETREVLVSPPDATLDSFDWRISLATVAGDGPFSVFQGIQRTLCITRGAGIRLQVGDASACTLNESSEPYTFDGEAPTTASLIEGPIVDLNVMSRRGRIRHSVERLSFTGKLPLAAAASATIVFCQRGDLMCVADETSCDLEPEDCVFLDGEPTRIDLVTAKLATVLVIQIYSAAHQENIRAPAT
jgi:uncharacterized protein